MKSNTKYITKRSGKHEPFEPKNIINAVLRAIEATASSCNISASLEQKDGAYVFANTVARSVCQSIDETFQFPFIPKVEDVQDLVEKELIAQNQAEIAKAYILYRDLHKRIRSTSNVMMDIDRTMNGYLSQDDWRVNENSNVNYSLGGLILHNSGAIVANYWLNSIYPAHVSAAHRDGDMHIHDLSMFSGYCAGWSLRQLLLEGFGGVKNKISSGPAKHLSTLISQMINFLGTMQNEWAGAQAFSSFDTYLAPFVRADGLSYNQIKQELQHFVFSINTPSRWGSQAPFTNITLDWTVPDDLKDQPVIVGGLEQNTTYRDYQVEMDLINRAFLEVMVEGDANSRGFAYPIPTYNITRSFDWDSPNAKRLFNMAAKYGTPYFQNFINSDLDPSDVRSMCCRLQLDKRELKRRGGGLFGADELTGSIGVVTINMGRIGYLSQSKEAYFEKLETIMNTAMESLEIKRTVINRLMNSNLFPYTKRYLKHLNNHFSTIGINGMNESCLNFLSLSLGHSEAIAFTKEVLEWMRNKLKRYQEETGTLYNLEATPAEATSYRLAKLDKQHYPDIHCSGKTDPYYTNSSQLPVDEFTDIFDALERQDELQCLYTGGTVFHGFLGEKLPNWQACRDLVHTIASSFRLPYFTITPTYSICQSHGYLSGEQFSCPNCHEETEVYSRIVGYYRPVQNWNKGKKSEYKLRATFSCPSESCVA
mgnify:CR=1 FL=1